MGGIKNVPMACGYGDPGILRPWRSGRPQFGVRRGCQDLLCSRARQWCGRPLGRDFTLIKCFSVRGINCSWRWSGISNF